MNVLVACEESQRVCIAFRERCHNAFSCDIIECSGGHPEWHIMDDCLKVIDGKCDFTTQDGNHHHIDGNWDLIIAHPPCTYLSNAGNGYFNVDKYGEYAKHRIEEREKAVDFFKRLLFAECDHIAVENPVGYMNGHYRKPDQTIHPYFFAESKDDTANYHKKKTCLWLRGLKPLVRTTFLEEPAPIYIDHESGKKRYYCDAIAGKSKDGKKLRSKTFPGIAKAMAEQWG